MNRVSNSITKMTYVFVALAFITIQASYTISFSTYLFFEEDLTKISSYVQV